jgi:pentatricopeptide repeat protein
MPYVKPTVHLSRIAGTALKSFTHGYAQTVVAASQSSYAAQNTTTGPLAESLIGRFRKSEKSRLQNVLHLTEHARHASTAVAGGSAGRTDTAQVDSGLDKYFEAWQKHQPNGAKEWQQFQFARRIEWQPPSTIPIATQEAADVEESFEAAEGAPVAPVLKRSYTTSALDNFGKAFLLDDKAEAFALEQVNTAIAEEVQRVKEESVAELSRSPSIASAGLSEAALSTSSATQFSPIDGSLIDSFAESDAYTEQLLRLAEKEEFAKIPEVFKGMLLSGVQRPSQDAYRALLGSAIVLSQSKHQRVPKALEVYSDMLRRRVVPDAATYGMLIDLLATRASDAVTLRKVLNERLNRFGGLEESGKFLFRSAEAEHAMVSEDNSLTIALKMFQRASKSSHAVPAEACAALTIASAAHGRIEDMTHVYQYMESRALAPQSSIYPAMIAAFGRVGDLRNAVEVYDEYKALAVANNANEISIDRIDNEVYASLIEAYGVAGRLKGGLKFLASIQASLGDATKLEETRDVVASKALLPLALKDATFQDAFNLSTSLSGRAQSAALTSIATAAADANSADVSMRAFEMLSRHTSDLAESSIAILAMHIRNANLEAAEPFWAVLESARAKKTFVEPTTMRAIALISVGQAARGLAQSRRMFARVREAQPENKLEQVSEQIDEAIELIGSFMLKNGVPFVPENGIEILQMMVDNGSLIPAIAEHVVARFGPEHIARLSQANLEFLLRVQSSMILEEMSADIANPARFGCILENIVSRGVMPAVGTENMIEKTLVNIDRAELSRLWNDYRYPTSPAIFSPPVVPLAAPAAFEETFDPYAARTDVKASNAINELLERPQGRRVSEALTKFRNMRRIGRIPKMFTYGKLIEAAAKENNLNLAHDLLEMAKQDVPFDGRYRVVRFGWQQILDHMVAACLNLGRRDLAAKFHQDMLEMGCAPSANTFGLYITTMKENTKTFDEATEAVKIFHRAKTEGVEPSSFLYNALIGKLGKARRIDDCLFYFAEMRNLGIRPTSVTYGTIVNALCRVSDEKFAEEIFEEMEACTNYKPRPAPYHSLMQFFLTTKRDRGKVLAYYDRMLARGIVPTVHTYKLLIDVHATLEPINMPAAEAVLVTMATARVAPEAVHYAALIHAKGCAQHDLPAARSLFDAVLSGTAPGLSAPLAPHPCLYQSLFEAINAARRVSADASALLRDLVSRNVDFTPYIANALIHGWGAIEKDIVQARQAFDRVPRGRREPSTYEAMVRAYLAVEQRENARAVVREALGRGYPAAVAGKIAELVR